MLAEYHRRWDEKIGGVFLFGTLLQCWPTNIGSDAIMMNDLDRSRFAASMLAERSRQ